MNADGVFYMNNINSTRVRSGWRTLYEAPSTNADGSARSSSEQQADVERAIDDIVWCIAGEKTVEATPPFVPLKIPLKPFSFA